MRGLPARPTVPKAPLRPTRQPASVKQVEEQRDSRQSEGVEATPPAAATPPKIRRVENSRLRLLPSSRTRVTEAKVIASASRAKPVFSTAAARRIYPSQIAPPAPEPSPIHELTSPEETAPIRKLARSVPFLTQTPSRVARAEPEPETVCKSQSLSMRAIARLFQRQSASPVGYQAWVQSFAQPVAVPSIPPPQTVATTKAPATPPSRWSWPAFGTPGQASDFSRRGAEAMPEPVIRRDAPSPRECKDRWPTLPAASGPDAMEEALAFWREQDRRRYLTEEQEGTYGPRRVSHRG